MSGKSTEDYVRHKNLELLRNKLARTTNEAKCQRIVSLIEEEEAKKAGQ